MKARLQGAATEKGATLLPQSAEQLLLQPHYRSGDVKIYLYFVRRCVWVLRSGVSRCVPRAGKCVRMPT